MRIKSPFKAGTNSGIRQEHALLAITPPRTGERTLLPVENLLQSVALPEPFSLELVGDQGGVRLVARCLDSQNVAAQIRAHYPQSRVTRLYTEDDPLLYGAGQEAWTTSLRPGGPEPASLHHSGDQGVHHEGSDPMLAVVGALSSLRPGERIISRILLRPLGPEWSTHYQSELDGQKTDRRQQERESRVNSGEIARLMLFGGGALVGLKTWQLWQAGDELRAIGLAGGAVVSAVAAAVVWARFRGGRPPFQDSPAVREKLSHMAFHAEIQVTAIVSQNEGRRRGEELLNLVAAAYQHYDNPAGAHLVTDKIRAASGIVELGPSPPGFFGRRGVLGVKEVASLWHPPNTRDETPPIERSGSRVLSPSLREMTDGAHAGNTTMDDRDKIRFPDDLLRRHHLYVARTRMGKSTLMQHIVDHKLQQKSQGLDDDAIVVIDPHADLVTSLLEVVPDELADRVRLIDLADPNGAPGINLLDTRIFTDRDRTADSVVRIARGLWDQWGPRMQSILEQVVKTLHEANERREADEQYTILDGLRLLASSNESFRHSVLKDVDDVHLLEWWARDFRSWHRQYQSEALAPVQTRLSYYATSKKARAILGQNRSTVDIRQTIRDGGILLVSTAQGVAGRDVSALVGSSLLNLVDAVIREQGERPIEERRAVLVVVDEMQSMPGVDYDSMLSELGKFGASFVLATQSLAKLDDLSRSMRHSVLANVGCLAVFQVAASDARQLADELGTDLVTQDDITSLPVHQCYVRATVGTRRMPAFSMEVRKPEPGNADVARRIRNATQEYTTGHPTLRARDTSLDRLIAEYRKGDADGSQPTPRDEHSQVLTDAPKDSARRHRRRRDRDEGDANESTTPQAGKGKTK